MRLYTTLRVGGPAELLYVATDPDNLCLLVSTAQRHNLPYYLMGEGSNVCVSDAGVRGLVIRNLCRQVEIGPLTSVAAGYNFMQSLRGDDASFEFSGLEWAIGIPGTVGGALVSNARRLRGEYRGYRREHRRR